MMERDPLQEWIICKRKRSAIFSKAQEDFEVWRKDRGYADMETLENQSLALLRDKELGEIIETPEGRVQKIANKPIIYKQRRSAQEETFDYTLHLLKEE